MPASNLAHPVVLPRFSPPGDQPMGVPPVSPGKPPPERDSQMFMLVGAAVLIPIMLGDTAYNSWIFRGKGGEGYPLE